MHRTKEHECPFQLLRTSHAHQAAVFPHCVLRIESDVRLRPERDLHLWDLTAVEFLVDLLCDPVQRINRLVRQSSGGFRIISHLRSTPPSRSNPSLPLPPRTRAHPPPRTRIP